jgi:hypothetical protein
MQEPADKGIPFEEPEAVLRHPGLNPAEKRSLLEGWRQTATGRGAADGAPAGGLLERIGRALEFLDTESGGREQTHERVLHGPGMAPDATPDGTGRER